MNQVNRCLNWLFRHPINEMLAWDSPVSIHACMGFPIGMGFETIYGTMVDGHRTKACKTRKYVISHILYIIK